MRLLAGFCWLSSGSPIVSTPESFVKTVPLSCPKQVISFFSGIIRILAKFVSRTGFCEARRRKVRVQGTEYYTLPYDMFWQSCKFNPLFFLITIFKKIKNSHNSWKNQAKRTFRVICQNPFGKALPAFCRVRNSTVHCCRVHCCDDED